MLKRKGHPNRCYQGTVHCLMLLDVHTRSSLVVYKETMLLENHMNNKIIMKQKNWFDCDLELRN